MTEAEVKALLERQAAWQRSRARLPWGEKLRMSLEMREAMVAMRRGRADLMRPRGAGDGAGAAGRSEALRG